MLQIIPCELIVTLATELTELVPFKGPRSEVTLSTGCRGLSFKMSM